MKRVTFCTYVQPPACRAIAALIALLFLASPSPAAAVQADDAALRPAAIPEAIGEVPGSDHLNLIVPVEQAELSGPEHGHLDIVNTDTPIGENVAARVQTIGYTDNPWDTGIIYPANGPVAEGDVLLAIFSARGIVPSPLENAVRLGMVYEIDGGDYTKSVSWGMSLPVTDQWQTFAVPFTSRTTSAAGGSHLAFRTGYGEQTLEIADVTLINFGNNVTPAQLPRTRQRYGGDEPDAAWRAEAEQRIERLRKSDFVLEIVDANGNAVPNAEVRATLARHAFRFGSTMNINVFPGGSFPEAQVEQYLAHAEQMFNAGGLENSMKWPFYHYDGVPEQVDAAIDWMNQRDWHVHAHVLMWPSWRHSPDWVEELADDPEALAAATDERVTSFARHFAGRVDAWDVVNEPYQQRDILDVLGHDVMDRWFHLAREADPDAKLFINENGFLSDPSTSSAKTDYYYDLVRGMRDRGVPIDGVGMQAHFTGQLPSMDHVFAVLDRFADLGVRLKITELDVDAGDKELEARFLADIVTAAFSHEAMDAIILWGFWEGRHWKPTAALLNQDFSPRITGDVWNNLLTERWHTDANLTTNAAGQATFRGFHGDYTLTIIHNTRTTTHTAHLTESGTLRLTLPE